MVPSLAVLPLDAFEVFILDWHLSKDPKVSRAPFGSPSVWSDSSCDSDTQDLVRLSVNLCILFTTGGKNNYLSFLFLSQGIREITASVKRGFWRIKFAEVDSSQRDAEDMLPMVD